MNDRPDTAAAADYRTRILPGVDAIGQADWDALLAADAREPTPFLRFAFLRALEAAGCVGGRTGWLPEFVTLWRGGRLHAAAPVYRKLHSYGEYVFDWAWADAYERNGLPYYPKLVCAVPFTPVPGPRLLARDAAARRALAAALLGHARDAGKVSSLHVLFVDDIDCAALEAVGLLARAGVQFHWRNPGWSGFDDYLAALSQPKRKKIRAERRRVHEAGVTCRIQTGAAIDPAALAYFHRCYVRTYRAHRSTPYLNVQFFERWAHEAPDDVVLSVARLDGRDAGAALLARSGPHLYGRYWGATDAVPLMHFETAYYAPIEWAIEQGIASFEGGAQGEHKLARGFGPVRTRSMHWLAHPAFAHAVQRYLEREAGGIDEYLDELDERLPFRGQAAPVPASEAPAP